MMLAMGDAHRAVYFAPKSAAAHNTLGTVLQGISLYVEAAEAYARAETLDTTALYAINNLCYLAFLEGHIETAIRRCDEAIRMNEAFAPARNNLALAYAAQGEFQQAWKHFVRASGEAVAHYNVGIVHLADKQYDAAVREFQAAYRIDPSFDAAHRRARQARVLAHGQLGDR
jgi:Flp pilus assembly protein TadD